MTKPAKADKVSQCMAYNKEESQTEAVVRAYCECMWDLWPDDAAENSVSEWEKTEAGIQAEKDCSKEAGWKDS